MRISTALFSAFILGAASQAHAELSGWCVGIAKDQSTFVTPMINLPPTSTEDEFKEWLETKTGKSIGYSSCHGYETRAEAESEHEASLQHMYRSGVNVTLLDGFTPSRSTAGQSTGSGGRPASSSRPRTSSHQANGGVGVAHKPAGSGPHLTVITDTSLIDARKEQEALVLQAQRDQAASIAKRVADTARSRADMQAKLAKLFEEMRKRGSAQ